MVGGYVFGQKDTSVLRSEVLEECFNISKYDDEYIISIGGVEYNDKEDVYICENDLPLDIQILYKNNNVAVNAQNWNWDDCECNSSTPPSYMATIDGINFEGDNNLTIKVRFTELNNIGDNQGDEIGLNVVLEIIDEAKIDVKDTYMVSDFSYDDNDIKNYPTFSDNHHHKIIPQLGSDVVVLKQEAILKGSNFDSGDPEKFSYSKVGDQLEIENILMPLNIENIIHNCQNVPFLRTSVLPPKNYIVELYSLCESGDDTPNYCHDRNGNTISFEPGLVAAGGTLPDFDGSLMPDCVTPIFDINHDCINIGADLSLDRFVDYNSKWQQQLNNPLESNDRLQYLDPTIPLADKRYVHQLRIKPSLTGSPAAPFFCNNRPQSVNDSGCTPLLNAADIATAENNLNALYNKANITFTINYMGRKKLNYDLIGIDNDTLDTDEQKWLHISLFGEHRSNINASPNIQAWIVPAITSDTKNAYGAATFIGNWNTISLRPDAIISTSPDYRWRTFAHEIGHAVFGLRHPDNDPAALNPITSGGDDLNAQEYGDKYNFMNSGKLFDAKPVSNISHFKIRKYQWIKF